MRKTNGKLIRKNGKFWKRTDNFVNCKACNFMKLKKKKNPTCENVFVCHVLEPTCSHWATFIYLISDKIIPTLKSNKVDPL